jgi:molybdate transport system substrate-binding protein
VIDSPAQDKILIAAASDLKFALDSLVAKFRERNHGNIEVTYGSSGKLTEQILNGAPFDIFFSADVSYPKKVKDAGKTSSDIYEYAKGHLVIWSKKTDPSKTQIKTLLEPTVRKIAIANPKHAPYGKRAVESLNHYGIFESIQDKLVYGSNISQTAQFVSAGAADIGIIALSLALSPTMKKENGKYYLIPEETHEPLIQGVVITDKGRDNKLASSFLEYIKSAPAMAVLSHFGFSRP